MINKNLIGKKIQDGRIKKNLTQEQLAEDVEISSNYLSKVERGLNMISADVLFYNTSYKINNRSNKITTFIKKLIFFD